MGRLSAIFDDGSGAERAVEELQAIGVMGARINDGKGDTGSGFLGGQASNQHGGMVVEADVPDELEPRARELMEHCGGRVYGGSEDEDGYARHADTGDGSGMDDRVAGGAGASGHNPTDLSGDRPAGLGRDMGGSSGMAGMSGSGSAGGMTGSRADAASGGMGMATQIREHMMVHAKGSGSMMGVSGTHVGTVDKLEGDQIKLTRNDSPDGQHHYIPLAWVERVDAEGNAVMLSVDADEVRQGWR